MGEAFAQARIDFEVTRTKCNKTREVLLSHETDHAGCPGALSQRGGEHISRWLLKRKRD